MAANASIAGYTRTLRYPVRRRVTFVHALKFVIYHIAYRSVNILRLDDVGYNHVLLSTSA